MMGRACRPKGTTVLYIYLAQCLLYGLFETYSKDFYIRRSWIFHRVCNCSQTPSIVDVDIYSFEEHTKRQLHDHRSMAHFFTWFISVVGSLCAVEVSIGIVALILRRRVSR